MNLKKNNKGFTMAELLIVVAIIAVLVAIAIPTFMNSLHKSQVASDEANARSFYAELQAHYMENADANYDTTTTGMALEQATGNTTKLTYSDGNVVTTRAGVVKVHFDSTNGWSVKYEEYKGGQHTASESTLYWGAKGDEWGVVNASGYQKDPTSSPETPEP